jgi:cytochrome c biogenesis protein
MTQTQVRDEATRDVAPPPLRPGELGRWAWRQLTSMRTALLLLFLLALASIPGSLIPQRQVNPVAVADFVRANPGLSRWYERFDLFDVFGSAWFAAIYLLLLVSLLGCVIPRAALHWRVVRSRPPRAPRHLDRLPEHRTWTTSVAPDDVLVAAEKELRAVHYRVDRRADSVAAERGYLREVGNLVFHLAIVVVLVGVAAGSLFGFRGTALVVVGNGFANTVTQYDGYQRGALFRDDQLPPFALTVDDFHVRFETQGEQRGSVRAFNAALTYTERPGAPEQSYDLSVNHPLRIDGAQVHLLGHGYAPRFTVRDGNGEVAFSGPVPFLPQDGRFTSTGVVKVPDARPEQLGFQGFFLPTAVVDPQRGPVSAFPAALAPSVFLTAYRGDLGLDSGVPQSVYQLETGQLTQFRAGEGEPFRVSLTPGERAALPGGAGSITFDGYARWVNLQVSRNPGEPVALAGAVLALGGLLLSLVVRRRRVWVRVTRDGERTVVAVAGLDRAEPGLGSSRRAAAVDAGADGASGGRAVGDGGGTRATTDAASSVAASDLAVEIDKLAAELRARAAPAREEQE